MIPSIHPLGSDGEARDGDSEERLQANVPDMEEMEGNAAAIIQEAEARATQLLREAEVEASRLRDEGYQMGYDEGLHTGHREGLKAAEQEANGIIGQAEFVLQSATAHRRQLLTDLAPALTELVTGAVKHLLYRELVTEPSEIGDMVKSMLDTPLLSGRVEVRVNPNEYSTAVLAHPAWQSRSSGEWTIAVVPDSAISAGGCELRYSAGRVDARLETKLELLEDAIAEFMEMRVNEFVHSVV